MITNLVLNDVGPAAKMLVDFSPRLNLITGDNSLGKTFILDCCWYALTRTWAGDVRLDPLGRGSRERPPQISFRAVGKSGQQIPTTATFDFDRQEWLLPQARPTMSGLVVYGRVDGSFAVWDPARNYWRDRDPELSDDVTGLPGPGRERPKAYQFSPNQVWDGLQENLSDRIVRDNCNGLLRDVESWRLEKDLAFDLLQEVLERLSPEDVKLEIREGMRVSLDDARKHPTIDFPYGRIPISLASAGIKRVLGLAYLIVWAWSEHRIASEKLKKPATDRIVVILDEVEAHLHPKWQRIFLPALVEVIQSSVMSGQAQSTQFIFSTHSPLVMSSGEALWNEETDRVIDLDLKENSVVARSIPFAKFGSADSWLKSPFFDLQSTYPRTTEELMAKTDDFMSHYPSPKHAPEIELKKLDKLLKQSVEAGDPYFALWLPYSLAARERE